MSWSEAAVLADEGLAIVDDVLSFGKVGVGKPSKREQALFLSATAMAYAVWENYVEQAAIELATFVAKTIDEASVPDGPKSELAKADAWSLSVHPGWRQLWIDPVKLRAIGSEEDFGLNTAGPQQVTKLFALVGVEAFKGLDTSRSSRLTDLVRARGAIVHTAKPPTPGFKKADATGWRDFVNELYCEFDESLRDQAEELVGERPW